MAKSIIAQLNSENQTHENFTWIINNIEHFWY